MPPPVPLTPALRNNWWFPARPTSALFSTVMPTD
jgi:hypothetical protein